jgi:hypothetical protein
MFSFIFITSGAILLATVINKVSSAPAQCPTTCESISHNDQCDWKDPICYSDTCNWDNGECLFIVVKRKLSWYDAEQYCLDHYHTHLATVTSTYERNTLFLLWKKYLKFKTSLWIGLKWIGQGDVYNKNDWVWSSSQHYDEDNWWRGQEPNHVPPQEDW